MKTSLKRIKFIPLTQVHQLNLVNVFNTSIKLSLAVKRALIRHFHIYFIKVDLSAASRILQLISMGSQWVSHFKHKSPKLSSVIDILTIRTVRTQRLATTLVPLSAGFCKQLIGHARHAHCRPIFSTFRAPSIYKYEA